PYAIFAGFHKPHAPLRAPKAFFDMYDPAAIVLPEEPPLSEQNYNVGAWYDDARLPATEQDRREVLQAYFACVS
ncbi:MAG: hypothetical protein GWO24_28845, partial [Akkermansiaceae bacterium]|nr:hypothetical protein [Akkermansiaceae bacterium]